MTQVDLVGQRRAAQFDVLATAAADGQSVEDGMGIDRIAELLESGGHYLGKQVDAGGDGGWVGQGGAGHDDLGERVRDL